MESRTRFIQSLFTSILAVWMIAASGGLALYHHFCQCTGNDHLALTEMHHCHIGMDHQTEGHHHASCCTHPEEESSCPADSHENCCTTALFFLVKTDNYLVSSASFLPLAPEALPLLFAWVSSLDELQPDQLDQEYIPEEPPPPKRKYCLTHLGAFHSSLSV